MMAKKTLIGDGAEKPAGKKKRKPRKRAVAGPSVPALHIQRVAVKRIKPARWNPRKDLVPGDPEYEGIKRSIEEFGCVQPLVWNRRTGNLIGGHQRLKILIAQGATELDVSVVDLPAPLEKALNVALNKSVGDWEEPKLAELLLELRALEDVDETSTGFDAAEIAVLVGALGPDVAGEPDEEHTKVGGDYRIVANCTGPRQQKEVEKMLRRKGVACHTLTRGTG